MIVKYLWRVIRKSLSIIVLISLTLHCMSRTGFLSYLYEQRYDIAFSLGVIDEIPIAMCDSSYYDTHELKVDIKSAPGHQSIPPVLTSASEIILFFKTANTFVDPHFTLISDSNLSAYLLPNYSGPTGSLFQPPRI